MMPISSRLLVIFAVGSLAASLGFVAAGSTEPATPVVGQAIALRVEHTQSHKYPGTSLVLVRVPTADLHRLNLEPVEGHEDRWTQGDPVAVTIRDVGLELGPIE